MPSRREYLRAAFAGILGGEIVPKDVDEADVEAMYRKAFTKSDSAGREMSFGVVNEESAQAGIVTPYMKSRTRVRSEGTLHVYDWIDAVAIESTVRDEDLRINTLVNLSLEEARELRELLTVAIEAHEEWGREYRPGGEDIPWWGESDG